MTLIDLPGKHQTAFDLAICIDTMRSGISDTNEARVELTHEFIKSCDYIWVVAPIDRIADDSTVNQLFSRYAKSFKGNICVICTHIDDGVVGEEDNLIDLFGEELEDHEHLLAPCPELKEEISRKTTEINRLSRKLKAAEEPRHSRGKTTATKQAIQKNLTDVKRQYCVSRRKFFTCVVLARNALITQQLIENLGSHMPEGSELDVHCVSSLHYAALKGKELHGPPLSAENTGIPGLRAHVLALAAPRLQETLEHYMNYAVPLNLKSFQAWLNGTAVDCRSELLNLVRQPQEDLEFFVGKRLSAFEKESTDRMEKVIEAALPEAKEAASRHVAKKRNKFGATNMAFVRKNGKHSTKICSRECWNEGFLRHFAEVVKECQHSLSEARQQLNEECKTTAVQRLDSLISNVEGQSSSDTQARIALIVLQLIRPRSRKARSSRKSKLASSVSTTHSSKASAITRVTLGGCHLSYNSQLIHSDIRSNLVIDATQDREKNIFSSSMQSIYNECNTESDRKRISSRSLDRLEAHLTQDGPRNPFAIASRNLTRGILKADRADILERVQTSISEIFTRLYISMDELLDDTQVGDAEAEARNQMKEVLPAQHADLKAICRDYAALKTKYEES